MLLTISTAMPQATDLGHLLHKHPGRAQAFPVASGTAHVFYPDATDERCTAALLLEVDPVALARSRAGDRFGLGSYVNDRPYAASSLLAMAIKQVLGTAMAGRSASHPELAARPIPLQVRVPALPSRGGADLVRRVFGPLGWRVEATAAPLDQAVPAWGEAPFLDVRLTGEVRLADALNHLYVLLPVLDDDKHYWVGDDEVAKLLRAGGGWLAAHPERDLIAARYLAHQRTLTADALDRLTDGDEAEPDDRAPQPVVPPTLAQQRRDAVLAEVQAVLPARVGDLGCGEGALLVPLLADRRIEHVLGTDVSVRALRTAARRLRLDDLPPARRARVELFQSSLVHRDARLAGLDVAVLMEVVEHVDPDRLPALERAVFVEAAPGRLVVTTPNAERNVRYPGLAGGGFRHPDHRFEWTRAQLAAWAEGVAARTGYAVRTAGVGEPDPDLGAPTQMAVFDRDAA